MAATPGSPMKHIDDVEYESGETNKVRIQSAEEKRAVLKLDMLLMPIMTMFYLLSFLDRSNIGNARIAGLQKDLKLTDNQYEIAITVTYVPYICAELPSNLLLRKVGAHILMPTILTLWGMIVALQGTVTSFSGLVAARFFLGLCEGPMFPGIVLYLSGFYTRRELAMRVAIFFSAASLSGAFSGLLAAAIENMDGLRGKSGWQWIFILEGVFSVLIGLIAFFIVPRTPQTVWALTQREKDILARRLTLDRPTIAPLDSFSSRHIIQSLKSPHVLILLLVLFFNGVTLYGLALFLPTIVSGLGFSKAKTQLVSVGPFAVGFVVTMICAYFSDRLQHRAGFIIFITALAVAGFSLFLGAHDNHIAYGSLFLSVPGAYALAPILCAWLSNNSEPHYRRASSIAFGFVMTNAGGIVSTWNYPTKEAPKYVKGEILNIVFSSLILILAIINYFYLKHQNNLKVINRAQLLAPYELEDSSSDGEKSQNGSLQHVNMDVGLSSAAERAWVELGDRHPDFVYVL